jgi:hypothetical protein
MGAHLTRMIQLSPSSKALGAPLWVADAIDGAHLLGEGSFARVFGCRDGSALKITRDPATIGLARRLVQGQSAPGFAPVLRACMLEGRRIPRMAVSMPTLSALPACWRAELALIYGRALLSAARLHGSKASTLAGARRWARRFARATPKAIGRAVPAHPGRTRVAWNAF